MVLLFWIEISEREEPVGRVVRRGSCLGEETQQTLPTKSPQEHPKKTRQAECPALASAATHPTALPGKVKRHGGSKKKLSTLSRLSCCLHAVWFALAACVERVRTRPCRVDPPPHKTPQYSSSSTSAKKLVFQGLSIRTTRRICLQQPCHHQGKPLAPSSIPAPTTGYRG